MAGENIEYCTGNNENNEFCVFFYQTLNQNFVLFSSFSILFVVVSFYLLGDTADKYLSPALARIAEKWGMSQTLAGVTILAFSNGAPDVISSFAAGGNSEGVPLVIGSIFGAGLFDFTLTTAAVIWTSKDIKAAKTSFIRDIVFYLLAMLYLMLLGLYGQVYYYTALGFHLIYAIYVMVVLIMEKKMINKKHALENVITQENAPTQNLVENIQDLNSEENEEILNNSFDKIPSRSMQQFRSEIKPTKSLFHNSFHHFESKHLKKQDSQQKKSLDPTTPLILQSDDPQNKSYFSGEKRIAWYKTLAFLIEYPLDVSRRLTMPAVEDRDWDKRIAIFQPFGLVFFWIYSLGYFTEIWAGIWIGFYFLPMTFILSLCIYKWTDSEKIHEQTIFTALITLLTSVMWIQVISNFIVNFLQFLGNLTGLHPTFLGMTVLAWGNTIGDLFANNALAKMGYGITGLTACFAGPLFNFLIGLGTSLLRQTLDSGNGKISFQIFSFDQASIQAGNILAVGVLLVVFSNLLQTLIYAFRNRFLLTKRYGILLFLVYWVVFIGAILYSIYLKISYGQIKVSNIFRSFFIN